MPDPATKRCSKCSEVKPLSEFHPRADAPDGYRSACRECVRESLHVHYMANRQALLEQKRLYREANHEKECEQDHKYYKANRDKLRERARTYREANHDAVLERKRERKAALRRQVFGHYGTMCACCGATGKLTIDHVNGDGAQHRKELFGAQIGGTRFYAWLITQGFPPGYQALCFPCNLSKRDSDRCRLDHTTKRELDGLSEPG